MRGCIRLVLERGNEQRASDVTRTFQHLRPFVLAHPRFAGMSELSEGGRAAQLRVSSHGMFTPPTFTPLYTPSHTADPTQAGCESGSIILRISKNKDDRGHFNL